MKNFIIILLIMFGCNSRDDIINTGMSSAECALVYDTNEALFTDEDTLTFAINVVYFMNGDTVPYDEQYIINKFNTASNYFSEARIKFHVVSYENIEGSPIEKLNLSTLAKKNIERYDLKNYQFFAMMLNKPHSINIYIYNEPDRTDFAGVAGGIGSDYLAIRKDYFDIGYRTLEHELGHCLGLYHTHQYDETDGYNVYNGDKVCDTPAVKSLSGKVNRVCDMIDPSIAVDTAHLKNIMSYAYPKCRDDFTEGQIKRVRWFIEQSQDLQSLLYNRHELFNKKLEEQWLEIE